MALVRSWGDDDDNLTTHSGTGSRHHLDSLKYLKFSRNLNFT